jgi:homopolymeric O-antigen transport system permease protein
MASTATSPSGFRKPTYVVSAKALLLSNPADIWNYRDLFFLITKRDLLATYKQTVLGPLWFFVQPFFASLVFSIIFGLIVRIPTTGLPFLVFFMTGFITWNLFFNCVSQVSQTFLVNRHIFQKIYFPRLIVPLSQVTVNFLNFAAQFGVLLLIIGYYNLTGTHIGLSPRMIFIPLILLCLTTFALGLGCLIAAWTVRYRDLNMLVGYSLQLLMYASCVLFPESIVPANLRWVVDLNPMAMLILALRSCLFGVEHYVLSIPALVVLLVIAIAGLWSFARAERNFTDTV